MVGLEHVLRFMQLIEMFFLRSRGPLAGKDAIMRYTNMGETALNECIRGGLPCFKIGGRLYAHTESIDEWFKARSRQQINVRREEDLKEDISQKED